MHHISRQKTSDGNSKRNGRIRKALEKLTEGKKSKKETKKKKRSEVTKKKKKKKRISGKI